MAEPVSPVLLQGKVDQEFIIGAPEGSEGVNPMPVLATNGHMLVRWKLTESERVAVALSGDLWIAWMGNSLCPHQPIAFPPVLKDGELAMYIDAKSDPIERLEQEMKDFKP